MTTENEINNAKQRFLSKRNAGISATRSDGSIRSEGTDVNATLAEKFAADLFGCKFNDEVYDNEGDGGLDFILDTTKGNKEVEVIWLGFHKDSTSPRKNGHLIVNQYEKHRWADIYMVVSGSVDDGFSFVGWTTHKELSKRPLKDFGYGKKMAMHTKDLYSKEQILKYLK
tara:strand:- start:7779 stop:8288 length:510 start_codon:yes stop_codon:yes gene_type:complete